MCVAHNIYKIYKLTKSMEIAQRNGMHTRHRHNSRLHLQPSQQNSLMTTIRTAKIEAFLLAEAVAAGVLVVSTRRTAKNPNKWAKHMAPWFNASCKTARARYRAAAKHNGSLHAHTVDLFKAFVQ